MLGSVVRGCGLSHVLGRRWFDASSLVGLGVFVGWGFGFGLMLECCDLDVVCLLLRFKD